MASDTELTPAERYLRTSAVARMYDYLLGGPHSLAVDRELAGRLLDICAPLRDARG